MKYEDPRYSTFVLPFKERVEAYKKVKADSSQKKKDAKKIYKDNIQALDKKKQEMVASGSKPHYAKAMLAGQYHSNKVRYEAQISEAKRDVSDSHYMIGPFHWFYKAVKANGNVLLKPRGQVLCSFLIMVILFFVSQFFLQFENLRFNGSDFLDILVELWGPSSNGLSPLTTWDLWFKYMFDTAIPLIIQTFEMMFIATAFGSIIAIPFMILCAGNIVNNKPTNVITHFILNIIRTIPTPVLGIMGVAFFNIGAGAGVFAMVVFTAGIIIKIMYEYIETVDMHPYEAILSTGASKPKAFVSSIFPEILPVFLSNIVYTFEINIRASVILGYVNAGGIGKEIEESMNMFQYNKVGAILVPLFVLVFALQLFSNWLKRRTQ